MQTTDRSVKTLFEAPAGFLRLAQCLDCTVTFPLPLEEMAERNRPDASIKQALASLRCPSCGSAAIGATMARVG